MERSLCVYGGFRLSARLAAKIHEVVLDMTREMFDRDLSHTEEHCEHCAEEILSRIDVPDLRDHEVTGSRS